MIYEKLPLKSNPKFFGSISKLYFIDWRASGLPWSKIITPGGNLDNVDIDPDTFLQINPAVYTASYVDTTEMAEAGKLCNSIITLRLNGLQPADINALQGWLYRRCIVVFYKACEELPRIMGSEDVGVEMFWDENIGATPQELATNAVRLTWQSAEKPRVFTGELFP